MGNIPLDIGVQFIKNLTATIKLSDARSKILAAKRSYSDSLKLSDIKKIYEQRKLSDTLKLVDARSKIWTLSRTYADTLKLVAVNTNTWHFENPTWIKNIVAEYGLSDVKKRDITRRPLTDNLKLSDAFWKSRVITLSATLVLGDLIKKRDIMKKLSASLKLSDGDITDIIRRRLTDTLKLTGVIRKSPSREIKNTLKLVDIIRKKPIRTLADTLKLSDATIEIIKVLAKLFSETLKLDDADVNAQSMKLLKDSLKLSDNRSKIWSLSRAYSDSLKLTSISRQGAGKNLTDSLVLEDLKYFIIGKLLTSDLKLSDGDITDIITRTLYEDVKLVDNYNRIWTLSRTYADNLKLVDILTKGTSRKLIEDVKLSDAIPIFDINKLLKNNLFLVDNYSRIWSLARTYSDTLKLVDIGTKHTKRTMPAEHLHLSDTDRKSVV